MAKKQKSELEEAQDLIVELKDSLRAAQHKYEMSNRKNRKIMRENGYYKTRLKQAQKMITDAGLVPPKE